VYLHFAVDAPPVLTEDVKELVADSTGEDAESIDVGVVGQRSRFVARVSGRTSAMEGHPTQFAVDTASLLFFDPQTGDALYGAGGIPQRTQTESLSSSR
jgi:multiple sugar transport system ATP-binding protein